MRRSPRGPAARGRAGGKENRRGARWIFRFQGVFPSVFQGLAGGQSTHGSTPGEAVARFGRGPVARARGAGREPRRAVPASGGAGRRAGRERAAGPGRGVGRGPGGPARARPRAAGCAPRRRSLLAAVRRAGGARGRKRRAQRARRAALRGQRRLAAAATARRSRARGALRPGHRALLAQRRGRGPAALGDRRASGGPPRSDSVGCHLVRRDDAAARGPARDRGLLQPRRPRRAGLADRPALALHLAGGRLARPATAQLRSQGADPGAGLRLRVAAARRPATRSKSKARRTRRFPGAAAGPTAASPSRLLETSGRRRRRAPPS